MINKEACGVTSGGGRSFSPVADSENIHGQHVLSFGNQEKALILEHYLEASSGPWPGGV